MNGTFKKKPGKGKGKGKGEWKPRDMSEVECHGCNKKGHFRRDCPLPEDQQKPWAPKGGGKGAPAAAAAPVTGGFTKALIDGWKAKGAGKGQAKAKAQAKPLKGLQVLPVKALQVFPEMKLEDGTVLTPYKKQRSQ